MIWSRESYFVLRENMKIKILKVVGITFISLVMFFALFIVEEIFRLSNSLQKPLVVFEEINTYDRTMYKSLGYSLKRGYDCKSDDLCIVNEVEFLLFDKFFIWGWIS